MRRRRVTRSLQHCVLATGMAFISVLSQADCTVPPAPEFPHLEAASLTSMELAHRNMQTFISRTEDYLECLSPEERKLKMDSVLATMKQVSSDYNALRSAYRKQQAMQLYSNGGS